MIKTKEAMRQINAFHKFYPATVQAMGGPKGLLQWWKSEELMSARAGRVFDAENERICRQRDQFLTVTRTELMHEITECVPPLPVKRSRKE